MNQTVKSAVISFGIDHFPASLRQSKPLSAFWAYESITYTFTENGTFTFEFVDSAGNTGTAKATVDWIDKDFPTATILCSTTDPTNQDVIAKLQPSETVTVTNNQGADSYTFTENGTFTFEFADAAGSTGAAISIVVWIYKEAPEAITHYAPAEITQSSVTITLIPDSDVVVTNNCGSLDYFFTENGAFTFEFVYPVGNTGTAIAVVDWIIQPGDVNFDGKVNLADAILSMQLMTCLVMEEEYFRGADVKQDGKLGLPEVSFILGVISKD